MGILHVTFPLDAQEAIRQDLLRPAVVCEAPGDDRCPAVIPEKHDHRSEEPDDTGGRLGFTITPGTGRLQLVGDAPVLG